MQEREGRERGDGSDVNNRRFSEDSALGEMMYRMSSSVGAVNPSNTYAQAAFFTALLSAKVVMPFFTQHSSED